MLFQRLLDLWVPLLILGAIALIMGTFFVVILIVCCWEKQRVRDFLPTTPDTLPPPSRYFQAMSDAARELGFQPDGVFGQDRPGSTYRCCISLWLSPDQKSILCIGGGKLARMDYKRTMFISRLAGEKSLVTMDAIGSEDLSETRDIEVLMNADLRELKQFHLGRLVSANGEVKLFNPGNLFTEFQQWNQVRADRLVQRGLAKYLSPEHNEWRFTLKGAWHYAVAAYFSGLKRAQAQKDRANKKRPGD